MAIQSAINNMIGTAGTVAAIGQHLNTEKKQVEATKEANDIAKNQAKIDVIKQEEGLIEDKHKTEDRISEIEGEMTGLRSSLSDKQLRNEKGQFASEELFKSNEKNYGDQQNLLNVNNAKLDLIKNIGKSMLEETEIKKLAALENRALFDNIKNGGNQ